MRELQDAGFVPESQPACADIILAHSGGCYLVPANNRAQLIVLVGMSGTPGTSNLRKVWLDLRTQYRHGTLGQWFIKTLWNGVYFWNIPQTMRMWKGWKAGAHRPLTQAIVIRNKDDPTCPPDLGHFNFDHNTPLISLPGQHDDCWHHPKPYVDIVRQYLHG